MGANMKGSLDTFNRRYLERAVSFAKRANAGVQDVDLPVLVLISNKRTADECDLDIQRTSELVVYDSCFARILRIDACHFFFIFLPGRSLEAWALIW